MAGYQRLIAGCELVVTDYVHFVPDDDYFSEPAMRRHAELLDATPQTVGAFGHAISFRIVNGPDHEDYHVELRNTAIENRPDYTFHHPITRILYATFEKSRAAYYCLYRRETLLRALLAAQKSSVFKGGSKADGTDSLIDSRCYYFGDLAMTISPLIAGTKINSGLASVGFQKGQSFDKGGESARKNNVPERLPHHRLLLEPSFEFAARAEQFINAMTQEYLDQQPAAEAAAVRDFFTDLTTAFFGALASGTTMISRYNNTCRALAMDPRKTIDELRRETTLTRTWQVTGEEFRNDYASRYAFLTEDVAQHYGVTKFKLYEIGNVDMAAARSLYSFERPSPIGTRESRSGEAKANERAPIDDETESGGWPFAGALARRLLPQGFRRG
ncbi:MAG: hypothetical protein APF80_08470 [Alphaproteobacteria bacterium BRH_c36]|nr:MAG: hypothetical protein APF80_08470 [Alphaproteobacteria bacterium BRH_c36]